MTRIPDATEGVAVSVREVSVAGRRRTSYSRGSKFLGCEGIHDVRPNRLELVFDSGKGGES